MCSFGTSMSHPLDGLVHLAVDLVGEHHRLADGELEALASHLLDQDRELEFTASLDLPRVRPFGRQHADRHVADQFGVEPVLDQPCGQLLAFATGER
jgi:hypothetical protein